MLTVLKAERKHVRSAQKFKSLVNVATYSVDDDGNTVLNPVPEHLKSFGYDGKALELGSLLMGAMPDDNLCQVIDGDQQEVAERITTQVVRRFGALDRQKEELKKKYLNNENT